MSDNEPLVKSWMATAERAGEDMWRLPLNTRLREQLKSSVADMRNTGDRMGGAITAGLFLKTFAKNTPWVHVDIAGDNLGLLVGPHGSTLDALEEIVRSGRARYLGASSMWAWQLAKLLWTADALGAPRFVSMQNHYNLIYR